MDEKALVAFGTHLGSHLGSILKLIANYDVVHYLIETAVSSQSIRLLDRARSFLTVGWCARQSFFALVLVFFFFPLFELASSSIGFSETTRLSRLRGLTLGLTTAGGFSRSTSSRSFGGSLFTCSRPPLDLLSFNKAEENHVVSNVKLLWSLFADSESFGPIEDYQRD